MIEELLELLHRQAAAATVLEDRLRVLQSAVSSDEHTRISAALERMEAAVEHLAALELTRVLALSAAGLPVDVTADDLAASVRDRDQAQRLRGAIDRLRVSVGRLVAAGR